jgi:hypothetical protein
MTQDPKRPQLDEDDYPGKPASGIRGGEPGARGGDDADTLPGAPGDSDTPLGDTDQHSRVPSQ